MAKNINELNVGETTTVYWAGVEMELERRSENHFAAKAPMASYGWGDTPEEALNDARSSYHCSMRF